VKLFYFRGEHGATNFGDELNLHLWPRLIPGGFESDGTQFVGIGTLLDDRLPSAPRTVIFGAGVGYYRLPRDLTNWSVYCVRGPLSARALGLPADAAVTDPAALILRVEGHRTPSGPRWPYAFMPHWQSQPDGWKRVCEEIGMGFIDPRSPPYRVLDQLRRTDVLIAEAMHGAIVADALRIPWVAVRTRGEINTFKWHDWCASLRMEYLPCVLPAIWPEPPQDRPVARARRRMKQALAGRALANVATRARPRLSASDALLERVRELERRLEEMKAKELQLRDGYACADRHRGRHVAHVGENDSAETSEPQR
jgi:succinoglycan biosynthesis protein ExoV